jgi:hypothetical protein
MKTPDPGRNAAQTLGLSQEHGRPDPPPSPKTPRKEEEGEALEANIYPPDPGRNGANTPGFRRKMAVRGGPPGEGGWDAFSAKNQNKHILTPRIRAGTGFGMPKFPGWFCFCHAPRVRCPDHSFLRNLGISSADTSGLKACRLPCIRTDVDVLFVTQ